MKAKKKRNNVAAKSARATRLLHDAEGAASGALVGAVTGAAAGPPGIVAGAVVGGIVGALSGDALDGASVQAAERDRLLDEEIGVSEGELGAPRLAHPEPTMGDPSVASSGVATASARLPKEPGGRSTTE